MITGPTVGSGAEEVTAPVGQKRALGPCPVRGAADETVEQHKRAIGRYLEDGPELSGAVASGGAEEIALRVLDETGDWGVAVIGSAGEAVENSALARVWNFKDGSEVVGAAGAGGEEEVAGGVAQKRILGECSTFGRASEDIKHPQLFLGRKPENRAKAFSPTACRSAIEVTCRIKDQPSEDLPAVLFAGEAVEQRQLSGGR